ncbi:MAG: hypothetical protein DWQ09_16000 [Proteobacteria bacterium]|nr:MAG: hypothetical protein DWQ09_16000 [Pseudomonadota bacterium]
MTEVQFVPGDVVLLQGEAYQVLENLGDEGMVIPFPSEEVEPFRLEWIVEGERARRIGNEPLPAPTPCSSGECPTQGNPVKMHFTPRKQQ